MVKRNFKSLVSLIIVFSILFGSFSSFAAGNTAFTKEANSVKEELEGIAKEKIHSDLQKEMDKNEYVRALVYFKDRVDVDKVASINSIGSTPYEKKLSSRNAVISSLMEKAETSQYRLLEYLEKAQENGNVREFKSYYIVNMVYVDATREVIENISYMDEVEKIFLDEVIEIEEPEIVDINNIISEVDGLEWNIEKIGADKVWEKGIDGTGVVVGLIDTGATWDHPALKEKWRGYNAVTGKTDPYGNWFDAIAGREMPYDIPEIPHGSHCLGTILGQEPDGSNKIGVAPGAKWIAAKAFTKEGGQASDLIAAGQWMLAPGGDSTKAPDVINNSWGGGGGSPWYRDIVKAWRAAEIFPVFSAGNEPNGKAPHGSISSPADYPESFAVAAIDINDNLGAFSRRGPSSFGSDMVKPEISAPGINIRSSVPGGYEGGWNGTSMAGPHVAGTVALMLSEDYSLTIDEIEEIIQETAKPLTNADYPETPNYGYGYGCIDALKAVEDSSTDNGIVKGQILADGEDIAAPRIIHDPISETFEHRSVFLEARMIDDVSIVEAKVKIKNENDTEWHEIDMLRESGSVKDGIYIGRITPDLIKEPGFKYKIKAKDFGGRVVETEEYTVTTKFGIKPDEYFTDFESYPEGWTFNGCWEWGEPILQKVPWEEPVIKPEPYSGKKLIGTQLHGDGIYPHNEDAWAITPPIDLRDSTLKAASIRLQHWYEIEDFDGAGLDDKGRVYISDDYGKTWKQVGLEYRSPKAPNGKWDDMFINLNDYIGSPEPIYVGFRLTSNAITAIKNYLGWYIDDFNLVSKDDVSPAIPTDLTTQLKPTGILLNWNKVLDKDLKGYNIYRSETSSGDYTLIGDTTGTIFLDDTTENNKTYYYVVTAYDYAENESEYSTEAEVKTDNTEIICYTNFEEDNGGFVTDGMHEVWEWGEPIWGVPAKGAKYVLTGSKVWATVLDDVYPRVKYSTFIQSREISLPEDGNLALYFNHWHEIDQYSYGQVHIMGEDDIWKNITPGKYVEGTSTDWEDSLISLNDYKGQDVKIRFVLNSAGYINRLGWYLNDFAIANLGTELTKFEIGEETVEELKFQDVEQQEVKQEEHDSSEEFEFDLRSIPISAKSFETLEEDLILNVEGTGIPLDAVVTVLETGRSVRTNPADGTYSLKVAPSEEELTLRVVAHGYYPKEVKFSVGPNETVTKDVSLDPLPRAGIKGKIIDKTSGNPIENAYIKILGNIGVEPVYSDEEGNFTIPNLLEGTYTLRVEFEGHVPRNVTVDLLPPQDAEVEVKLGVFIPYEKEIGYDDGTAENAINLKDKHKGTAIRITPEEYGEVLGTNIYFWDTSWPLPGGDEIGVVIFDTDEEGNPGEMIGLPKFVTIERGAWNFIDLSEYNFATDRDFFISTIQSNTGQYSPGTGIDWSNDEDNNRCYMYVLDRFKPIIDEGWAGTLMIRAIMGVPAGSPEITNLQEINYTNKDKITVEGEALSDCTVNVYVNGEKVAALETENQYFSGEIELLAEENLITVSAELNGAETGQSSPVKVIKDTLAPELNVATPLDNERINTEVVHIIGNVTDAYFDRLLINDEIQEVDEEGNFSKRILVDEGENTIILKAYDLAGNESIVERKVYVDLEDPVIQDIEPVEDAIYEVGETVKVSFKSKTEGEGYFRIVLPITGASQVDTRVTMVESEEVPGLYEGEWTISEGFAIRDGLIEIEFIDAAGNRTTATAPGKITILDLSGSEPMEDLPANTVIVGDEAFDIRYLNNNEEAQLKLIEWYSRGEEIYIKLSDSLIVNIRGEEVEIEELPDELTYYDASGMATRYVRN